MAHLLSRHAAWRARPALLAICLVLLAVTGCLRPEPAVRGGDKLPDSFSINYVGTFEMSNKAVPQSTAHSYSYHVEWLYAWSGKGAELMPAGRITSAPTKFPFVEIRGTVEATYRDKADGPDKHCTMSVSANPAVPPSFVASYDAKTDELSIIQLEAPTFRLSVIAPPTGVECAGGPGVNIFSAPADWSPLGGGGGKVGKAALDGTNRYDRHWQWTHTFDRGQTREYDASMKSKVDYVIDRPTFPELPPAK